MVSTLFAAQRGGLTCRTAKQKVESDTAPAFTAMGEAEKNVKSDRCWSKILKGSVGAQRAARNMEKIRSPQKRVSVGGKPFEGSTI